MGHHHVPQEYLKGFAVSDCPGSVWQYDKRERRFSDKPAAIKKVAQEKCFYSDDDEVNLNNLIEKPGNEVLCKLRAGKTLDKTDRWPFAVYMATMIWRVPRQRERADKEVAPKSLSNTVADFKAMLDVELTAKGADTATFERYHAEVDAVAEGFRKKHPPQIVEQIRAPWPSRRVVELIFDMTWRLIRSDGPSFFVTSDNPMFFFEGLGFTNADSEFTFPISPYLALCGSWIRTSKPNRVHNSQRFVREFNKRIFSGASRFLFCHVKQSWVEELAKKRNPYLSKLRW